MKLFLMTLMTVFLTGCMDTPEVSPSSKDTAKTQITSNIDAAQQAKNEYEALQQKRQL